MFSWGNNKSSLAETLGLNTLKYRESRDKFVVDCSANLLTTIRLDLGTISKRSISPEAVFNLTDAELQKKVFDLGTASAQERDRILVNISNKLKEEKLETSIDGTVLVVKWTVPVAAPQAPVVQQTPVEVVTVVSAEVVTESK